MEPPLCCRHLLRRRVTEKHEVKMTVAPLFIGVIAINTEAIYDAKNAGFHAQE
jgi:hypothetical protein